MEQTCISPGAVEDWQLDAYADGIRLPGIEAHLERCPACRARLAQNQGWERGMRQALHRVDCPSTDWLRDFWWGYLAAGERRQVEEHVRTCPHCTRELSELDTFMAQGQKSQERPEEGARGVARRLSFILARLVSPSLQPGWALRGPTGEELLFEAGDVALSISIKQEGAGAYTLFGQVLAEAPVPDGSYARLTALDAPAETPPQRAPLGPNGSFAIPGLARGRYQLSISVIDQRIVVPLLAVPKEP